MYFITINLPMKNYYEILEVNSNASPEVIENSYKTLAEKYHPDAWPSHKSYWAEDRFKEISVAYYTLSNPTLRKQYDARNGINNSFETKYNDLYNENEKLKSEINNMKAENNSNNTNSSFMSFFKKYTGNLSALIKNEFNVSPEERSKNFKALLLTIIIISILLFVFWKIPFLHNFLFP